MSASQQQNKPGGKTVRDVDEQVFASNGGVDDGGLDDDEEEDDVDDPVLAGVGDADAWAVARARIRSRSSVIDTSLMELM